MLKKLLGLFKKKTEVKDKIKKVKQLDLDPYSIKTIYTRFEFINSDIITTIEDMKAILNSPNIKTEIIKVKMISKETKHYITFGEWFTDKGYFLENPKEVLKEWCNVSKKFIKLCNEAEHSDSRRMVQNFRQIRPYKNEIDIITEFLLNSV